MVAGAALVAAAAAGCSAPGHGSGGGIASDGAYVQLPKSTGQATVGYLDIRNNGAADSLVSVSTSVGGTVELLGPDGKDGASVAMKQVSSIPLPANETTQLVPNSYHLLITGAGAMHDGKDIQLRLTFAHAAPITINALVTNPQNGGASYFLGD